VAGPGRVLERAFGQMPTRISAALTGLIQAAEPVVEDADGVATAPIA
jgi:hypothetical protein